MLDLRGILGGAAQLKTNERYRDTCASIIQDLLKHIARKNPDAAGKLLATLNSKCCKAFEYDDFSPFAFVWMIGSVALPSLPFDVQMEDEDFPPPNTREAFIRHLADRSLNERSLAMLTKLGFSFYDMQKSDQDVIPNQIHDKVLSTIDANNPELGHAIRTFMKKYNYV